jgi:hypothetical protein
MQGGSGEKEEVGSVSESKLPSSIHSRPFKQMRRYGGKKVGEKSEGSTARINNRTSQF